MYWSNKNLNITPVSENKQEKLCLKLILWFKLFSDSSVLQDNLKQVCRYK